MPLRVPEPGLVVCYGYVWRHEREAGREESRKDRPCVIILAVEQQERTFVTIAPVTHTPPAAPSVGIEIPPRVKRHLGLDGEKSWAIISEVNQFAWPGYDLRPIANKPGRYDYGFLPPKLFEQIRTNMLDLFVKRRLLVTKRD